MNYYRVIGVVVFLLSACAMDRERMMIESTRSFENAVVADSVEQKALNGGDGEMHVFQRESLLRQVTPLNTRYDTRSGKLCRDMHIDSFFQQEHKSVNKTVCHYNGQWYVVNIDGKSTIRSGSGANYGQYGGVPSWAAGFQYVPSFVPYGGSGLYGRGYIGGRW